MPSTEINDSPGSELGPLDHAHHRPFRADIEGLRAIAVLVVVAYHSSVPGFSGGYVGVDVFFVISGYLIAGTLLREVESTSTVRLSRFWARRIRRLVPALSVMVVFTWIAGLWIQSPLGWVSLAREGASAATYTSNILFARERGGYFVSAESPFLHTWSLSVEEQFYLGWPILMVLAIKLFDARQTRLTLVGLFSAVTLVSFVMCVVATNRGTPWAYFSAPTRAWEFGLGALLALVGGRISRIGRFPRRVAVIVGLGAILFAATRFDRLTPFPGFLAAVPVLGSLLVVAGGIHGHAGLPSRLLATPVLQTLGRLSYSWYLWHWPLLVLAAMAVGPLSIPEQVGVSISALGVAALSYHLVERPIRFGSWMRPPLRSIGFGVLSMVVLVACSVGIRLAADRALADPYLVALVAAREGRSDTGPSDSCTVEAFGGVDHCVYGPDGATRMLVLVGDSHAAQWSPAVIEAATSSGAQVLVRTYGGCPAIDVPVRATGESGVSSACERFRQETRRLIETVHPDLVVMSNADYTDRLLDPDGEGLLSRADAVRLWADEIGVYARSLRDREVPLAVIENNPSMPRDPIECLARHRDPERCAANSDPLLAQLAVVAGPEREELERSGVAGILEVAPLICDDEKCRVEDESGAIYSDGNHLSESFVLSKTTLVADLLAGALN